MPTIDNWRALREALEAGPTEGERFTQGALPWYTDNDKFVQFQTFDISTGSQDRQHDDYYLICSVSNISNDPCNKANAKLIAAADPTTIRALLDERDRLAAEVEALRADAKRYRWIRDECSGEPRVGDHCPAIHLYALQGASEDAWNETAIATNHLGDTIDAARGIKEGGAV